MRASLSARRLFDRSTERLALNAAAAYRLFPVTSPALRDPYFAPAGRERRRRIIVGPALSTGPFDFWRWTVCCHFGLAAPAASARSPAAPRGAASSSTTFRSCARAPDAMHREADGRPRAALSADYARRLACCRGRSSPFLRQQVGNSHVHPRAAGRAAPELGDGLQPSRGSSVSASAACAVPTPPASRPSRRAAPPLEVEAPVIATDAADRPRPTGRGGQDETHCSMLAGPAERA